MNHRRDETAPTSALAELAGRRARHRSAALAVTVAACAIGVLTPAWTLWLQLALASVAVLALGLPHGALDALVALRSERLGSRCAPLPFLAGYLALAALTAAAWIAAPLPALGVFLAASALHFGIGDQDSVRYPGLAWPEILTRGSAPIVLPLCFHASEVGQLFAWLTGASPSAAHAWLAATAPLIATTWLVLAGVALATPQLVPQPPRQGSAWARQLELPVLVVAFALLPPLVSFALYFAVWHSPRHLLALDVLLCARDGRTRRSLVLAAAPILGAALALFGVAHALHARTLLDPAALVRTLFVGLAALTLPHMLVTAIIDRARLRGCARQCGTSATVTTFFSATSTSTRRVVGSKPGTATVST